MKKNISLLLVMCMFFVLSTNAYAVTPAHEDNYSWDLSSLKCYINSNISRDYGSSISAAIENGIKSWNTTDAPSVTVSNSINWDVFAEMGDYGATGWDGYCSVFWTEKNGNRVTDYAHIYLNTNALEDYLTDTNLWKALACHEMGHAYGLGHNSTSGESSIMKSHTLSYYNYSGTTPKWTTPLTADRTAVNDIY